MEKNLISKNRYALRGKYALGRRTPAEIKTAITDVIGNSKNESDDNFLRFTARNRHTFGNIK